jgi:hypothetical protein
MNDTDITDAKTKFLIGLERLTRETGIIISGCGCCGSPSLDLATPEELEDECAGYEYSSQVRWVAPCDGYYWDTYGKGVVKSSPTPTNKRTLTG